MASIITVELHGGHDDPFELQTPPEKTAAIVLDICSRRFTRGKVACQGDPDFLLEGEDVVARGMTHVFTPTAGCQGMQ